MYPLVFIYLFLSGLLQSLNTIEKNDAHFWQTQTAFYCYIQTLNIKASMKLWCSEIPITPGSCWKF